MSSSAKPIDPINPSESVGVWPRPRLSKRASALGLNYTQWGYVLAGYTLWDAGRSLWEETIAPLAHRVPWTFAQGQLAWLLFCGVVTVVLVFATYHGLHAYRVWQRVWADLTRPRISVWRPVDVAWEERAVEEAEEDERDNTRRRQAQRAPVTDAANPMGWVVD